MNKNIEMLSYKPELIPVPDIVFLLDVDDAVNRIIERNKVEWIIGKKRYKKLFSIIPRLKSKGFDDNKIFEKCCKLNDKKFKPPLPKSEIIDMVFKGFEGKKIRFKNNLQPLKYKEIIAEIKKRHNDLNFTIIDNNSDADVKKNAQFVADYIKKSIFCASNNT